MPKSNSCGAFANAPYGTFMIPPHHKKHFVQAKFYAAYKQFWLVGSLAFVIIWYTLAELGGMPNGFPHI
ncbi:MAG: hypothetical protein HOO87_08450 [Methyloglobulus sp.]|nr:hypothetical protein [Methyloglobulus sp.]